MGTAGTLAAMFGARNPIFVYGNNHSIPVARFLAVRFKDTGWGRDAHETDTRTSQTNGTGTTGSRRTGTTGSRRTGDTGGAGTHPPVRVYRARYTPREGPHTHEENSFVLNGCSLPWLVRLTLHADDVLLATEGASSQRLSTDYKDTYIHYPDTYGIAGSAGLCPTTS